MRVADCLPKMSVNEENDRGRGVAAELIENRRSFAALSRRSKELVGILGWRIAAANGNGEDDATHIRRPYREPPDLFRFLRRSAQRHSSSSCSQRSFLFCRRAAASDSNAEYWQNFLLDCSTTNAFNEVPAVCLFNSKAFSKVSSQIVFWGGLWFPEKRLHEERDLARASVRLYCLCFFADRSLGSLPALRADCCCCSVAVKPCSFYYARELVIHYLVFFVTRIALVSISALSKSKNGSFRHRRWGVCGNLCEGWILWELWSAEIPRLHCARRGSRRSRCLVQWDVR